MKGQFNQGVALLSGLLLLSAAGSAQQIQSMKLLSAQIGWATSGNHLYWTTDDGAHWKDIAPPMSSKLEESIADVFFLDTSTGWVVLSYGNDEGQQFRLASTSNAGANWSSSPIKLPWARYADDFMDRARVFFLDSLHGWVDLRVYSSSAFKPALLLATEDGGKTWKAPTDDSGRAGKFCFFSLKDGVLAGGPADTELWVTHDSLKSWQQLELKVPPGSSPADADFPTYGEPICKDAKSGFLPVTFSGSEEGSVLVLFVTDDGGHTWKPDRTRSSLELKSPGQTVVATVVGSDLIFVPHEKTVVEKTLELATIPATGRSASVATRVTGSASARQLSFVNSSTGWASTNDGLLSTTDGGVTWIQIAPVRTSKPDPPLALPKGKPVRPDSSLRLPGSPASIGAPGAIPNFDFYTDIHLGFDTKYAPAVSDMQTWWNYSPYYSYQISLPGAINHKTNPNLTNPKLNWITNVENQGWGLWPNWVGPQAPCADVTNNITLIAATNSKQAYADGQTEAAKAISALENFGLAGVLYYDMENYNTSNSTCVSIVIGFLNGWINGIQAAGLKAGVYGNVAPVAQNFSQLSPLPDDVWVTVTPGTSTPPNVSIWSLTNTSKPITPLCDIFSKPPCPLWSTDQRIHQYLTDVSETWGNVKTSIDPDIIDADVAYVSTGTKNYTYSFSTFPESGNEDFPYSINNIGAATSTYGGFISASPSDVAGNIGQNLVLTELYTGGILTDWGYWIVTDGGNYVVQPPPYPQVGNCFGTQHYDCTQMSSVNNAGSIVGYWTDLNSLNHGFLSQGPTSIDAPGAAINGTFATSINDAGLIVGYYEDASANYHGFLYNSKTMQFVAAPLDDPNGGGMAGEGTILYSINGDGQILGGYGGASGSGYFLYSNGNFNSVLAKCEPGAWYISPRSVNDNGQIVGSYTSIVGGYLNTDGFVSYDGGQSCSTLDFPSGVGATELFGINDAGQISGSWLVNPTYAFIALPQTP